MDELVKWKFDGLFKADARRVADEIFSIGETATPEQILEKARDPETELHRCFDWDDTVAAEKWRLQQARQVARSIVFIPANTKTEQPLRLMFKPDGDTGYRSTRLILKNPDVYENLLATALRELNAFKQKYKSLTELEVLFEEIDRLLG